MIFAQWEQVIGLKEPPKGQTRRPVKPKRHDKPLPKRFDSTGYGDVTCEDVFLPADAGDFYELGGTPFPGPGVYVEWTIRYPGELGGEGDVDVFYAAKYIIGRTYAVQRPDKKTVGQFLLTGIRRERLGDISEEDCLAEGVVQVSRVSITVAPGMKGTMYGCPVCGKRARLPGGAYACLWNDCYGKGAWDRMKDDDVWVLEWPLVGGSNG